MSNLATQDPLCGSNAPPIDAGTLCLNATPVPAPVGMAASGQERRVQGEKSDAALTRIRSLVQANNRSSLDVDVVVCQIYMESRFDANAGARRDAKGLLQMQANAVKQVFKYRKQKELDRMPSDKETEAAFAEGATFHKSAKMFDGAINVALGTEYMQYLIDTSPSVEEAYKRYRGLANGVYYRKLSVCAAAMRHAPGSMQPLRDMVK